MLIKYKRNKRTACFHSNIPMLTSEPEVPQKLCGPFESCGACPYACHGLMCYTEEGDCLRTDMQNISQKTKEESHAQSNAEA